jgi:hypothetical protein
VNSPTIKTGNNFANNGGITIPNSSFSNPYPSRIIVNGLGGTISKVTLSLNGINAPALDHVDFLLVGPGGQKFLFLGDAGGTTLVAGVNLTLDDAAAGFVPDNGPLVSGTFKPSSYTGDSDLFPLPPAAPFNQAAPEGTGTFAMFNGIVPNGTWSLYAVEDTGDALDTALAGWSLTFTVAAAATTTTVVSSVNPSYKNQNVTFTATVATAGVTPTGNVQFLDDGNPLGAPVGLSPAGQAQFTTGSLTPGNHTITAQYLGDVPSGFSASSGQLTQSVNVLTAGGTGLSGRVFGLGGRGVTNARVTITSVSGETRSVITGRSGAFAFEGLESGQTYVISVESARFRFSAKTVSVTDDIAGLVFTPDE